MTRNEVLNQLAEYYTENRERLGIRRLGLFGSMARADSASVGDVDIVVELETADLFTLVAIKQEVEASLGLPVDVVRLRLHMNPTLKKHIERDAIYV